MASEAGVVARTERPLTVESLCRDLVTAGVEAGEVLLVHSSMSSLGWTSGGPVAVIEALLAALGARGTLVMPAHGGENSDPSQWQNPAVPRSWWPIIRESVPAFDPAKSPTRGMGRIAEAFRSWPGALRSYHPTTSFSALGPEAAYITEGHDLRDNLGEASPLGRLYELDARVLLLGVGHDSNTSLHLAEARATWPGKRMVADGCAVLVDGARRWVEYEHVDWSSDDFDRIGREFEEACGIGPTRVGLAPVRLFRQRELVDFGVRWIEANRDRRPEQDRE